ncbi:hypothetical protein L249_3177 [Ophiocordyceps polyrhachis-furcata BCC 54312]|uniref:Ima1 N-terminal domain-containing protein n=1 Tax=Ophiocordyceps polyrhachis-furcata BCC 54312 TaxID=1330021 RepID=A0A367LRZ9_9HYPO|nr:hypothetical protein L249_3177 [Ophiocordyceps polyrhachis-furcata BCC 54312]
MERFRATRYLSCFYCGRRSGLKNDGNTRDFVCLHCDATNYLDERGEITDPPVATDREATTTKLFTAPKPLPASTDSIFCTTCLKNQYLLTSSLAQYLPDDPSDPDYAPLERNYHRYRRGLEKRYPQVCDGCASRVEARLRQAGYAAKTDHLRRMMELGRGRKTASANTALDWVDCLGGLVWAAGFALQLLWHLVAVAPLLRDAGDGLRDPDEAGLAVVATTWLGRLASVLPAPELLVRWSVVAAVVAAWWNPYFVQLFRGFTRHLSGFSRWYSFQGLLVVARLACWSLAGVEGHSRQALLSLHMAMATVMILMYFLAQRSIRVDTSPLFGVENHKEEAALSLVKSKDEAPKTLSDMLTDALEAAPGSPCRQEQSGADPYQPLNRLARNPKPSAAAGGSVCRGDGLVADPAAASRLCAQPSPRKIMSMPDQQTTTQGKNPFWYKVPAAPSNPARQLRNPRRAADPVTKPAVEEADGFTFFPATTREKKGRSRKSDGVEFRQPQFFAPERDDASSLADLLGQSFSLSQEGDQDGDEEGDDGDKQGRIDMRQGKSKRGSHGGASRRHLRLLEPMTLVGLPVLWALTLIFAVPFRNELQTALITAAGVIAFFGAGEQRNGSAAGQLLAAWATAELAASCWRAVVVWLRRADVDGRSRGTETARVDGMNGKTGERERASQGVEGRRRTPPLSCRRGSSGRAKPSSRGWNTKSLDIGGMPHADKVEPTIAGVVLRVNDGRLKPSEVSLLRVSYPTEPLDRLRERYKTEGYVFLKGLLPREDVLKAREAYFTSVSSSGVLKAGTRPVDGIFDSDASAADFPGIGAASVANSRPGSTPAAALFVDLALAAHTSKWYAGSEDDDDDGFARHPALRDFVAAFSGWGGRTLGVRRSLLRNNTPGNGAIGVHYDQSFMRYGEPTAVTAWVPMGDVRLEGGGLIYLEGGDALGQQFEADFNKRAKEAGMSDEEMRSAFNAHMMSSGFLSNGPAEFGREHGRRWLVAEYEAGDVVLHRPHMIHASTINDDPDGRIRLGTDLRQRWNKHFRFDDGV